MLWGRTYRRVRVELERIMPTGLRGDIGVLWLAFISKSSGSRRGFLRAFRLRRASRKFARILDKEKFGSRVIFSPGRRVEVDAKGILLSVEGTDRYWKSSLEWQSSNEGELVQRFLQRFEVEPVCIVDAGANFGEMALYLAKHYPSCRLIAIEPSPANLRVLQGNVLAQSWKVKNLEIIECAVAEIDGGFNLETGLGSQDRIIDQNKGSGRKEVVSVRGVTLSTLFHDYQVESVSFLKLDIEGSEIRVLPDLILNSSRIESGIIEVGSLYSKDEKESILKTLSQKYVLLDTSFRRIEEGALYNTLLNSNNDLFFIRQDVWSMSNRAMQT